MRLKRPFLTFTTNYYIFITPKFQQSCRFLFVWTIHLLFRTSKLASILVAFSLYCSKLPHSRSTRYKVRFISQYCATSSMRHLVILWADSRFGCCKLKFRWYYSMPIKIIVRRNQILSFLPLGSGNCFENPLKVEGPFGFCQFYCSLRMCHVWAAFWRFIPDIHIIIFGHSKPLPIFLRVHMWFSKCAYLHFWCKLKAVVVYSGGQNKYLGIVIQRYLLPCSVLLMQVPAVSNVYTNTSIRLPRSPD